MCVKTIFAYLIGHRPAILEVASDRRALGVAALLVLSAALARNYDRVSLIDEPWRLLGPFVASLAIGGSLFLSVYGYARWKGMRGPGIGLASLAFLALYWMTAPLAWLYGIPYERFLTLVGATKANLWTLALVSVWRLVLMIRVVSVVFGLRIRTAVALVMLAADVLALMALFVVPLPMIPVMGGLSPEQAAIALPAIAVTLLELLSLPCWIVFAGIVTSSSLNRPEWQVPSPPEGPRSGRAALAFAWLMVAAWAVLLPFMQPEQILAKRVERTYRKSGPAAALALMSAHIPGDFPPDWQPPPRESVGDPPTSEVLDSLEALAMHPHAEWVDDAYCRRFRERLWYDPTNWPRELFEQHAARLAELLPRLHQGPEMARALDQGFPSIQGFLKYESGITKDQRAALEALLRLGGLEKKEPGEEPIAK